MAQWPHERSLVKNLKDKPFALIGVHLNNGDDDASVVKKVMIKEQLNWRTFVDQGAIAEKWKPAGTPAYYIIDPQGVIRYKWAGAPGAKAIDAALEKVIQEAAGNANDAP
ncbi:MAG TPA: TlpA disulfide reductase family protein [Verrucomicrobiae bacterium]|nr:TlpA disulfide reductase family protein [Verrucomicrobiae bacterium]